MHFERSPFTIGFLSGAVARERRRGERGLGEAGRLAAAAWRGAHASRTATHAPGGLPPRSPAGPRAPPRCRFGQSSSSPLASSPGSPLLPPRVERLRRSHSRAPAPPAGRRSRGAGARGRSSPLASELSELAAPAPCWASGCGRPTRSPSVPGDPPRRRSQARERPSRPQPGEQAGAPGGGAFRPLPARPRLSPWRRISSPGSRLTWRRTRSAPCLR